MSGQHRPEVGNVVGVKEWAAGEHYCTIICTNGHKKRTIERVKAEGQRGELLYTAAARMLEDNDPGTSAELNPVSDDYKWRLWCPTCPLDVPLNNQSLEKLAHWVGITSARRLQLGQLAATIGG